MSNVVETAREALGPVGVWTAVWRGAPITERRALAARIEELGYGSIWTGEILGGLEAFSHAATVLSSTDHIVFGTGIANLWAREPATMQAGAATIAALWPDRFDLGIGVSHAPVVAAGERTYAKPMDRITSYLDGMDKEAEAVPPEHPFPRLLAALRPRMLELAKEKADGAHPYFVPVEHTEAARNALGPDKLLVPEQAVLLETDATKARAIARTHTVRYLALPNYVNNLKHLGWAEEDLAGEGSDRLVDAIVAWGDEDRIATRVQEHRAAGADSVVVQALGEGVEMVRSQLERLAPALLGH
jgi:probable F420-dependent oxidoreductase